MPALCISIAHFIETADSVSMSAQSPEAPAESKSKGNIAGELSDVINAELSALARVSEDCTIPKNQLLERLHPLVEAVSAKVDAIAPSKCH